jgi:E3 ubiquitin-protein ligase mind-bomb
MIPQQPPLNGPVSGTSTDDQIYSNLEAMNIGNNQNNNIMYSGNSLGNQNEQNQSFESDNTAATQQSSLGSSGTSNPPTPARRNKTNQITRDAASSPLHAEDATKQLNTEVRGHSTMSPLTLPPSGSSGMIPGASNNDNEFEFSGATTMNTPATGARHISRRQPQLPDSNVTATPPQPAPKSSAHSNHPQECIVCNEVTILIIFDPCCHQISCEECGMRMKKCLACGVPIDRRFRVDGLQMQLSGKDNKEKEQPRHLSADRVKYLERKIVEIEETHCCSIW